MFRSYYNLERAPFEKSIKKENLFESASLKEFRSRMEYMKQNRGLILILGASGIGKTTAIRTFIEDLKPDFFKPVYLPLATVTTPEFYRQLNRELGGESAFRKCDLFHSIQNLILDYATVKKQIPVIVFDESHFLKNENLHELQMLLNFNLDSLDPAIVALCGQPHLRATLARTAFSSINQRFRLKYEFSPLTKEETREYLQHNLKLANGSLNLFNDNAIDAIHSVSSGIMRIINNLATKTLLYGATNRQERITEETVFKVSSEL